MDTLLAALPTASNTPQTEVYANQLIDFFNQYCDGIKVLSLDCFDTLLWRTTITPIDMFYNLQHRPSFKKLNFAANLRVHAEALARKLNMIQHQHTETTLEEIYLASFPHLTALERKALAEDELAEEIATCYAFPPVIELIRHATARGVKVIIVSDTYLQKEELQRLLQNHLPEDVMTAIDQIYCSCEYGKSKSDGLFAKILKQKALKPQAILHIGDNHQADFLSPKAHGLHALHFIQHNDHTAEILRMETLAGNFMDASIRLTRAMTSPFRGLRAITQHEKTLPASAIGFSAIGPILYSFAKFILAEVEAITQLGKKPKVLFLMRDGYLPSLVCDAVLGKTVGSRVRISRFVALASSFRTQKDIDRYLSEVVNTLRFNDMARQLLLPSTLAKTIIQKAKSAGNYSGVEFIRLIHEKKTQQVIFAQSKAYRARLVKHLEKEAQIEPNDTLMFVDLGYTGTAQIQLAPIFKDEMNIDIVGCYLIGLKTPGWESNRRGLLDPSWCDDRTLLMLVNYIALLEQLCTSNESSVVDFDDMGNPIFSNTALSREQHAKLVDIQTECVAFAKAAEKFFGETKMQFNSRMFQDAGAASLGRLLFIPTETELAYLQSFEFDLNMGTEDILKVFNCEEGLIGLRRRGLFFMERNAKSMRTNYPAELRSAGLELSLILMLQHRYGLDIKMKDLSLKREQLQIIIMRGNEVTQTVSPAQATYDGYYSLLIPVGVGDYRVGIQFGANYRWVQIESAELIKTSAILTQNESLHTMDATSFLIADQMASKEGGLFECLGKEALIMLNYTGTLAAENLVLRVVFRPIA